ncbi:MAG: hypothetical protein EBR82_55940, partial [Caulobacteraceae bacterium]|nr:hypothetical protein [Caulobacteraceae bacterium]
PEFGTSQLDRNTAIQQMVAAGVSSDRANELLNGIDAQNTIKLENKLSVQSAYQNFVGGKGSEEALRSAMTSAGYTDTEIENQVLRGRAYLEGLKLTAGEQAQQRAELLPDIRAEIAGKSTFNDAFTTAREKLGAGATFTWQGKLYSTATAEENPALSGKPVLTTNAFNNTIQDGDIASRLNMGLDAADVRSMIRHQMKDDSNFYATLLLRVLKQFMMKRHQQSSYHHLRLLQLLDPVRQVLSQQHLSLIGYWQGAI